MSNSGKCQGEFRERADADRAARELVAAGIPASHVHVWNMIPESGPARAGTGATRTGAITGALLGGLTGLAVGATLGRAVDAASAERPPMPDPSGARVVVDDAPAGVDVPALLRAAGATNVR